MSLLATLLFATTFVASVWTIVVTVRSRLPLIVHLLQHGAVVTPELPPLSRGSARTTPVRVLSVGSVGLRAAA